MSMHIPRKKTCFLKAGFFPAITLCFAVVILLSGHGWAAVSWDGGGGVDNKWSNALNWSGDVIPNADSTIIDSGYPAVWDSAAPNIALICSPTATTSCFAWDLSPFSNDAAISAIAMVPKPRAMALLMMAGCGTVFLCFRRKRTCSVLGSFSLHLPYRHAKR